jgi:hypothetical protein
VIVRSAEADQRMVAEASGHSTRIVALEEFPRPKCAESSLWLR